MMEKSDITISIASGALTALIVDVFIIGDISFLNAKFEGEKSVNTFVVNIAKRLDKDGRVTDLTSAVRFLEDNYPIPADSVTKSFGGGTHHHLYDFSHHPTPLGWFCSILSQFSGHAYGTDKTGKFIDPVKITEKGLDSIYSDPISKVWNGTIDWIFHMVSDMAGSSGTIAKNKRGTGLPGPILSLLKEVSSYEGIRNRFRTAGNTDRDEFSVFVQNLFNGRILADRSIDGKVNNKTIIPFDLRTEIGLGLEFAKQTIPVIINECIVRAFYSVTRFVEELKRVNVSSVSDLRKLDFRAFLPFNNPELNQMLLISSASFSTVDITAAGIKAAIKNPGNKYGFAKDFLLGINYVGVLRLNLAVLGVTVAPEKLEKLYDDYSKLSEKIKDSKIVGVISEVPLGTVPASQKVLKELQDAISEYQDAKEERIRIQKECEENIQVLTEYRNEIETEVSAYLVDNLTVFNEAFDQMNEAILNNDSDTYIDANAKIQNQLGKDMQFHSQDEFDGLMDSDDDFKL